MQVHMGHSSSRVTRNVYGHVLQAVDRGLVERTRRTVPGQIARERASKRLLRGQRTGRWPGLSERERGGDIVNFSAFTPPCTHSRW